MPIDPNIALGYRGIEVPNPLAGMAQVTQIQNALQQQRMGGIQMQNALREQARQQELESIMSGLSPTAPASEQAAALQKRGFFPQAQSIIQQAATLSKTQREAEDARLKALTSKAELMGRFFSPVTDQPTYEAARQQAIAAGLGTEQEIPTTYDPSTVQRVLNNAMSLKDQIAARQREQEVIARSTSARAAASQAMTARDKFEWEKANPGFTVQDTEQGLMKVDKRTGAMSPLTMGGQPVMGTRNVPTIRQLQLARDQLPPNSTDRAQIDAQIDALGRGAAPTLTEVVDPNDPARMLRVDARIYQGGGVGSPGVVGVSGKEPTAGRREITQEEGRSDFLTVIDQLRSNFDELNRMRAIQSTERGAVSNIGAAAAGSTAGQMVGRAVGTREQALRDQINSSRMQLMSALKKITGKSAQELNSNVELRLNLDAVSNVSQGYEAAMGILDNLEKLYVRGQSAAGKSSTPAAAPTGAPKVGDVLDGYRFKGGDPSQQSNWTKVGD